MNLPILKIRSWKYWVFDKWPHLQQAYDSSLIGSFQQLPPSLVPPCGAPGLVRTRHGVHVSTKNVDVEISPHQKESLGKSKTYYFHYTSNLHYPNATNFWLSLEFRLESHLLCLRINILGSSTDTDPNTGKNHSSPIFRYSSEFRYFSCSWETKQQ